MIKIISLYHKITLEEVKINWLKVIEIEVDINFLFIANALVSYGSSALKQQKLVLSVLETRLPKSRCQYGCTASGALGENLFFVSSSFWLLPASLA